MNMSLLHCINWILDTFFVAGDFYFSVPSNDLKIGDSWELDSRRFTVKGEKFLKVFGMFEQVYLVGMIMQKN